MSIFNLAHGSFAGSFSEKQAMSKPSTLIEVSEHSTSFLSFPCTESYFKRCALSLGDPRSLIATISI